MFELDPFENCICCLGKFQCEGESCCLLINYHNKEVVARNRLLETCMKIPCYLNRHSGSEFGKIPGFLNQIYL